MKLCTVNQDSEQANPKKHHLADKVKKFYRVLNEIWLWMMIFNEIVVLKHECKILLLHGKAKQAFWEFNKIKWIKVLNETRIFKGVLTHPKHT